MDKGLKIILTLGAAVIIGIPLFIWYAYPAWTDSVIVDIIMIPIVAVVGYIFFGSIGCSAILTILNPFYAASKTELTDASLKLYSFLGFISVASFLFTDFGGVVTIGCIIACVARFNYDKNNFPEK